LKGKQVIKEFQAGLPVVFIAITSDKGVCQSFLQLQLNDSPPPPSVHGDIDGDG
jgi:hypothetical protein